jgi:hypothetical protein
LIVQRPGGDAGLTSALALRILPRFLAFGKAALGVVALRALQPSNDYTGLDVIKGLRRDLWISVGLRFNGHFFHRDAAMWTRTLTLAHIEGMLKMRAGM